MARHLFISYSDKDKAFAELLLTALERRGVTCWMAPRDIPPGGSYADAIIRAIEESECFLLVYTTHSNTSPHVLREVERALKFERNIIPIRFDDSEPSRSLDYLLATVQWLSIDPSKASGEVSRIADEITNCLAPREPKETPKSRAAAAPDRISAATTVPRQTLARLLIPLLILLAIAFGSFLIYNLSPRGQHQLGEKAASAPPPGAVPLPSLTAQVASVEKREEPSALLSPSPVQSTMTSKPVEQPAASQPQPSNITEPSSEETAPQNVVRKYFNSFAERDVSTAYNLFSTTFRNGISFRKYSDLFFSTREIKLSESILVNQTRYNALVFVRFEEIDAQYRKVDWQGPIELVRDGSEWRIATLRGLKKE
jgi:TIR domain.